MRLPGGRDALQRRLPPAHGGPDQLRPLRQRLPAAHDVPQRDLRLMGARAWRLGAVLAIVGGCGARTGLNLPDATTLPDVPDASDAPDARDVLLPPRCIPGRFTLTQRGADMMLVIDRSGSMGQSLGGGRGSPAKWELLRDALSSTLPAFQDRIRVGALFFPQDGADTRVSACELANIPSVDIRPAYGAATQVLGVFAGTEPGGSTPTAAALLRAYNYFVRNPDRARARYLVLATDGGPNCNAALAAASCVCVGAGGTGPFGGGASCRRDADGRRCLDNERTVREIAELAANPVASIPTFVIGLADETDPNYAATLTAMAIAGGRPFVSASGAPGYYNVERAADLTRAFTTIQDTVSRCSFVTPSRPEETGSIAITAAGETVPPDPTRRDGWDWTDRAFGELTFFGPACARVIASRATQVQATVRCADDGG
jgi:hypothetical protein